MTEYLISRTQQLIALQGTLAILHFSAIAILCGLLFLLVYVLLLAILCFVFWSVNASLAGAFVVAISTLMVAVSMPLGRNSYSTFLVTVSYDLTHQELSFRPGVFVYDHSFSIGVKSMF